VLIHNRHPNRILHILHAALEMTAKDAEFEIGNFTTVLCDTAVQGHNLPSNSLSFNTVRHEHSSKIQTNITCSNRINRKTYNR